MSALDEAANAFADTAPALESTAAEPQADKKAAAPAVPTADMLYPLARLAFDKGAPLWAVSDEEVLSLCDAYGALLDKYFPDGFLDRFGVELSAIMVTLSVFGPRWGTPMKPAARPKPAAQEQSRATSEQAA